MGINPLFVSGNGFTDSPMGMYRQLKAGSHEKLRRELIEILGLPADRHVTEDEIIEAVRRLVEAAGS